MMAQVAMALVVLGGGNDAEDVGHDNCFFVSLPLREVIGNPK